MSVRRASSSRLGRKLLIRILLVSGLLTVVLAAGQLYRDYRMDLGLIDQRLEEIRDTHLNSIVDNL